MRSTPGVSRIAAFGLAICSLSVAGQAIGNTFQDYPGAPRPAAEIATLGLAPVVVWFEIGGVRVERNQYDAVAWPPGRYEVGWRARFPVSFMIHPTMSLKDERRETVELEAGHRYVVTADRAVGTTRTYFWIEDASTGRIVAGMKNPKGMSRDQELRQLTLGDEAVAEFLGAAAEGDVETLRRLTGEGVDVNCRDRHRRTPLIYAASYDRSEAIDYLLELGADVNVKMGPPYGATALMAAATCWPGPSTDERPRCLRSVERLLEHPDLNIEARDADGRTALMAAASWARRTGSTDVIERLLERGAEVNAVDRQGRTALDWAKGKAAKKVLRAAGGKYGREL